MMAVFFIIVKFKVIGNILPIDLYSWGALHQGFCDSAEPLEKVFILSDKSQIGGIGELASGDWATARGVRAD